MRITNTSKYTKVIIGEVFIIEFIEHGDIVESSRRKDIKEMRSHMKGFIPECERKPRMKQKSTNGII